MMNLNHVVYLELIQNPSFILKGGEIGRFAQVIGSILSH